MDRYGKGDARAAFERLAGALNKPTGASGTVKDGKWRGNVGTWVLDCNPTYGGYVIAEIVNEGGGESHPLGDMRRTAREFCYAVNFALRVLEASR